MKYSLVFKKSAAVLMSAIMLISTPAIASATETTDTQTTESTESTESSEGEGESTGSNPDALTDDEMASFDQEDKENMREEAMEELGVEASGDDVLITSDMKPYLALGVDLSINQRAAVLALMGLDDDDLFEYDVITIFNKDEHEYLDSYISSDKIGTRALSSVVVVPTEAGSGLNVTTYNIDYCTVGMYKNALITAGITDADIIVAAPCTISGTSALVGIFKAYEMKLGYELPSDSKNVAVAEMVITGDLSDKLPDVDNQIIEGIIAILKNKAVNGELKSDSDMETAIVDAGATYGVTFEKNEIKQIKSLLTAYNNMDLSLDGVAARAESVVQSLKDYVEPEGNFFQRLIYKVKRFFKNLFHIEDEEDDETADADQTGAGEGTENSESSTETGDSSQETEAGSTESTESTETTESN